MPVSDPVKPQQAQSLRDRVASLFHPRSSRNGSQSPSAFSAHRGGGEESETPTPPPPGEVNFRTRLLESYNHLEPACGFRSCDHGTFSPRPGSSSARGASPVRRNGIGNYYDSPHEGSSVHSVDRGDAICAPPRVPPRATTKQLAKQHGVKNHRTMYISYYVPFFIWITQYRWSLLKGDLTAAITVASIYIPMALSLASNVAQAPAINGLYGFVFSPFAYAILGSSPTMVIGPEAAGSLLVGTVIRGAIDAGDSTDDNAVLNAQIIGVVTGLAGAMVLIAGITRLGFLDNILSRPFLRGFISAIGFMIFVDQLIPQLGLAPLAKQSGSAHGSSVEKLGFLFRHISSTHGLTCAVAFGSFAIIMIFRILKRRLEPRFPAVVFFPDRFLVVFLSTILTWQLRWDTKGLEVLGSLKETGNPTFAFRWPYKWSHLKHLPTAMSTSFIISLLGFFESSVAAKGLGDGNTAIKRMALSANRELVALGVANVIGGCFMALPAFGGYGRSKLNAATGAKSPMSSIFLCLITLLCILFMLPYFYYLPMAVLSSMISVVAISLIEEAPHDLRFFFNIGGWSELSLILIIFFATIFYSLYLGIALGIGLSILQIIRHATKPRIQILGKVNGTHDRFENAEIQPEKVEFIEGCLIVKIPEPLTFANTGDLKNRLRRLEFYGTTAAHPALPRVRAPEHNRNMIFDIHGVTSIDGSGIQVLSEIVQGYVDQGVRVFFCRYPRPGTAIFRMMEKSGIVEAAGGMKHFTRSVDEALRLAERSDLDEP
ncbi:uncharacterized protein PADG_06159 [Paracoccidioides brasiliensis Pb18]|uniref:STAS domain-containing protein n=2 Tax=Paracoccidioides brasiliensis TaxID=121759 RepID=C1GFX3_PARBD|nr:uncharacterized protein PADG_06159 [Paracoccidioides brasiliensis Pb18]EEH50080.1 hypothetical protein PADG_06159 [Paracoccidioides brasiliensis Pb18]ODH27528.1 hypothetical protein ACO22_04162 [Paracoccidioides brasiliensis]ODH51221.1 hypothetical protein GX48_02648 [Paracoccidioides brasiliensis]